MRRRRRRRVRRQPVRQIWMSSRMNAPIEEGRRGIFERIDIDRKQRREKKRK